MVLPRKIHRKPISYPLRHPLLVVCQGQRLLLFGSQRDREAQLLQSANGPAFGRGKGLFVGVARSQFAVGLLFFEQVIDDDQDAVRQGYDGFLGYGTDSSPIRQFWGHLCYSVGPHYPVAKHKTPLRRRTRGCLLAVVIGSACFLGRPRLLGSTQGGGAMR
jgi:hypothetical protein